MSNNDRELRARIAQLERAVAALQAGGGGGGIGEAPNDGQDYVRKSTAWAVADYFSGDYNDLSNTPAPGVSDHGALSGLGDNDHPQYPLTAGTETVDGNWTFENLLSFGGVTTTSTIEQTLGGNFTFNAVSSYEFNTTPANGLAVFNLEGRFNQLLDARAGLDISGLTGSGNNLAIDISGTVYRSALLLEAPSDGSDYVRRDGAWEPAAYFNGSHGSLTNLTNNDHPQYPLSAGTETIDGNWTFENALSFGGVTTTSTVEQSLGGTLIFNASSGYQFDTTPANGLAVFNLEGRFNQLLDARNGLEVTGGISFDGGPDLLDAYEEGTWTPGLADSNASAGEGQTYVTQAGNYTRIGRLVFFVGEIEMSSLGTLSGAQPARIIGFPYTPASIRHGGLHSTVASSMSLTGSGTITGYPTATGEFILTQLRSTAGTISVKVSEITASGRLIFSGWYMV